jgi:hypothetical protein
MVFMDLHAASLPYVCLKQYILAMHDLPSYVTPKTNKRRAPTFISVGALPQSYAYEL